MQRTPLFRAFTPSRLAALLVAAATLAPSAATAAAPTCTPASVSYFGGRVVSNAKVIQVNWGSGVSAAVDAFLPAWYAGVLDSPFMDVLVQYGTVGRNGQDGNPGSNQYISRGTVGGRYVITPAINTTTSVTGADVAGEIVAQIAAGKIPVPEVDAAGNVTSIYMVDFPPGVSIALTSGGSTLHSCVDFCDYHDTVSLAGKSVPFGVFPDVSTGPCSTGCGAATLLDNVAQAHAHELAEAVTDAEVGLATGFARPLAWNSTSCGEIGDSCNGLAGSVVGADGVSRVVQQIWSNEAQSCLASPAAPVPGCDGTTAATCRHCVAADVGRAGGCTGATALCDLTASSPTYGQCVAPPPPPPPASHGGGCSSSGEPTFAGLALAGLLALRGRRRVLGGVGRERSRWVTP